jgi:hypothetical protein
MDVAREEIGDLAESEEDVVSYAIFGPVAREFLQRRKAGGIPADDPTVAAIAALVAQKEGMLETLVSDQERPQVQLTLTRSAWRAGSRPRVRQLGGTPRW